jgi:hypothetical protein
MPKNLKEAIVAGWPLLLVFGVGLAIRVIALANINIINPDGILYIYQAKTIAAGQWHLLNQCQLTYVSIYPFLIAFFHLFVSSWPLSAQLVSLCSGFGMLLILYPLLRLFFNLVVSRLTTLLLALTPVFVRYSVDAMRDATYWLFFTAALWLFLLHIRQKAGAMRSHAFLIGSSCLILLAVWSRVEALIVLPVTSLFICVGRGERKALRLLVFLLPWICLASAGWFLMSAYGFDIFSLIRVDEVVAKIFDPAAAYQAVRGEVKALANVHDLTAIGYFLQNAYHSMWLIAIGSIFTNAMESFFYPFIVFYLVGMGGMYKQIQQRTEYLYMAMIFAFSLCVLFVHVVQFWIMTYRFLAILIIPCCVLAGLGLQRLIPILCRSLQWGEKKVIALIVVFIVSTALYKNVGPIESDKAVFVQIGNRVSQLSSGNQPVGVAGQFSVAHNWVAFYANAERSNPVCYYSFVVEPTSLADLKSMMHAKGLQFFLWEEFSWNKSHFGQEKSEFVDEFEELGHWRHDDTGELILFRLKM